MGLAVPAHALDLGEPLAADQMRWSAGIQSAWTSYGFSAKYRATDKTTVQGIIAPLGSVTNFGVRGLYQVWQQDQLATYGFAGLSLWTVDIGIGGDESAIGFSGGFGAEYEVAPRIFASAELAIGGVSWDTYSGLSAIGLGLGLHYSF